MSDLERHSGISIHRMAIGGGIMAAVFTIGTVLNFCYWSAAGPLVSAGKCIAGSCRGRCPIYLAQTQPARNSRPSPPVLTRRE